MSSCDICGTNFGDCPDCIRMEAKIEELRYTISDLERERDDLLDKVRRYRNLVEGWAADMQYELRGLK